ncbi:MAG: tyrosine-type recombinase/integrase [Candidatus Acidiferrales bacterium]
MEGTLEGKYLRQSLKVRSWERAEKKIREMEEGGQSQRITLEHACESFIQDARSRGLRPPSLYKYELLFRRLKDFAKNEGFAYLSQFDLETLRKFRATWQHKNFAARNKTENLRALFRFSHDAGWLKENPAKKLKSPKITSTPTQPFTRTEFARILKACDGYRGRNAELLKAFVLLLRYSGLRIRDAVTLRQDAVVDGKLFLHSAKTGVPVRLPLPPDCLEALATIGTSERFFWSAEGLPKTRVANFQTMLASLFKSAGIVSGYAHRFRDTFAVELLLAGIPLDRVAVLLGNTVKVADRHYAPWVRARQEQLEDDVRKTWK